MRLASPPRPATGGDGGRVDHCYYSDVSFALLLPFAVAYTALSNLSLRLYESSLSFFTVGGGSIDGTCERRRRWLAPLLREDCIVPLMPRLEESSLQSSSLASSGGENQDSQSSRRSRGSFHPVAVVTGSNTGIGYETSLELVRRGYDVVLACRSRYKGEEAARSINESVVRAKADAGGMGEMGNGRAAQGAVTAATAGCVAQAGPGRATFVHPCDLSSLDSVRSFVDALRRRGQREDVCQRGGGGDDVDDDGRDSSTTNTKGEDDDDFRYEGVLHLLVNNAGINTNGVSSDGLDLCFQSNFLGHYLLTRLLLPDLRRARHSVRCRTGRRTASAVGNGGDITAVAEVDGCEEERDEEAGRIVNLSSVMHHFASPNPIPTTADGWVCRCIEVDGGGYPRGGGTYADSKLAAILFSMELNRRSGCDGDDDGDTDATTSTREMGEGDSTQPPSPRVRAVAVNPGAVNSDIWRAIPEPLLTYIVGPVFRLLYLCTRQGSTTSVAAAVGDLPDGAMYLQPYWLPEVSRHGLRRECVGRTGRSFSSSPPSFRTWYFCPFPAFEMLGPYVGHAVTEPRLPSPREAANSAAALWDACEVVVCRHAKGCVEAVQSVSSS